MARWKEASVVNNVSVSHITKTDAAFCVWCDLIGLGKCNTKILVSPKPNFGIDINFIYN